MWIDSGIDTGNIIASETTTFTGEESLLQVHIKVMEHAHDLYVRAIQKLDREAVSGIQQSAIGEGRVYYTKQWTLAKKIQLRKNFRQFKSAFASGTRPKITTVKLNSETK
jgi:methionyl-tRNA formyltransferase